VICPNCQGTKMEETTIEIASPKKYESVTRPCTFCEGEGIMDKTETYTPINP
jgi:DnaJ-class molecular chaperone